MLYKDANDPSAVVVEVDQIQSEQLMKILKKYKIRRKVSDTVSQVYRGIISCSL